MNGTTLLGNCPLNRNVKFNHQRTSRQPHFKRTVCLHQSEIFKYLLNLNVIYFIDLIESLESVANRS